MFEWLREAFGEIANYEDLNAGRIDLFDPKSCDDCERMGKSICSNDHCTMILNSDRCLFKVNIEEYLSRVRRNRSHTDSSCDLLLCDSSKHKIALCELYCGKKEYLDNSKGYKCSKKAKAYDQITKTISNLTSADCAKEEINSFEERIGIFGYRLKDLTPNDKVTQSMSEMVPDFGTESLSTSMIGNFKFVTVPFPEQYIW